jgi:hypothetical protein
VPWVATIVTGSPEIGFPDAFRAATNASHGPLGVAVFAGVASRANDATDTSRSAMTELVPPPGDELSTAIKIEVPETSADAGTVAVNSVEDRNVVGAELPFSMICDVAMKLLPLTEITVAGDPVARLEGETDDARGTGLFTAKGAFAAPPPGVGLFTTTENVPAAARSVALRVMINWVLLTSVAVWAAPL